MRFRQSETTSKRRLKGDRLLLSPFLSSCFKIVFLLKIVYNESNNLYCLTVKIAG